MQSIKTIVAFWLVFLIFALPVLGKNRSDWRNVLKLKRGSEIIVKTVHAETVQGKIGDVTPKEILIITDSHKVIKLQENEIVEVRKPVSMSKSIFFGSASGAGVGLVTGLAFGLGSEGSEFDSLVTLGTTLIGAGIGAGLGAVHARAGNKLVYRRVDNSSD